MTEPLRVYDADVPDTAGTGPGPVESPTIVASPEPTRAPAWYQEAVIYELHVRAFADSNGDGVGDFGGLLSKLDYLQDLGVTALWLLPFYPSPLRDDGYDIADYSTINEAYGNMRTFRRFLREAHDRGLRVISEIVINHTSDQHPWFQRARSAPPGSPERNVYVWSDDPTRYNQARIIFEDFEQSNWTWDPVAGAYYWHRFYSHQPDLNFDNPAVQKLVLGVVDQWLSMGVDGIRLDAVPYLFERDETNCENLPETHEFLRTLRSHIDSRYDDRMLLAEANQWPEDAAAYFGQGDECHMNFHFPLMPRMFIAVQQENRGPIVEVIEQTPITPERCQWATFLRNHDELTLEMVTDEERDYMYRSYAADPQMKLNVGIRRRLAPLLGNDRRKIELLNFVLFSLPGTPVLYYGDEIGMGDNIYLGDRDGVRTPMQWTADRNAGFSTANPHSLYLPPIIETSYHYERVNVEAQRSDPQSLLVWMRQLIGVRRSHPVLSGGGVTFLDPDNHRVLAHIRSMPGQSPILVVCNLSRLSQSVELDLRDHAGAKPRELFGGTDFATIGELPYYLTLSPYACFWFELTSDDDRHSPAAGTPALEQAWADQFSGRSPAILTALGWWLPRRRWFAGKDRRIVSMALEDSVVLGDQRKREIVLCLVRVAYAEGEPDRYVVPLTRLSGLRGHHVQTYRPDAIVATGPDDEIVVDAMADDQAAATLIQALVGRRSDRQLSRVSTPDLRASLRRAGDRVRLLDVEQSNTSVIVGDDVILKLVRRLEPGENPDVEIGRHLARRGFAHTAPVVGSASWRRDRDRDDTIAVAFRFIHNEGDAWRSTLDHLSRFYDDVLTQVPGEAPSSSEALTLGIDDDAWDLIGAHLHDMIRLGERTAELHGALAAPGHPGFEPEPFTALYRRSLYQSFRTSIRGTLSLLRRRRNRLDPGLTTVAEEVLEHRSALESVIDPLRHQPLDTVTIRTHGDFHLGQVLVSGGDFMIIDFEGEPNRPVSERRIKRSPLADVAGMVRSFDYAAHVGLAERTERGLLTSPADPRARSWAAWWRQQVTAAYLSGYLTHPAVSDLLPPGPDERRLLLESYVLDKTLYELRYELGNRPDWVGIPLDAIAATVARRRADGAP